MERYGQREIWESVRWGWHLKGEWGECAGGSGGGGRRSRSPFGLWLRWTVSFFFKESYWWPLILKEERGRLEGGRKEGRGREMRKTTGEEGRRRKGRGRDEGW